MVRFFGPDTDAFVDSVVRHADEFREQSGLELEIRIIGSDEYFSNSIGRYLEGDGAADVFMSGPVLLWEHIGREAVEPLDDYTAAASPEFDLDDFLPALIRDNRWSGAFGDPLGKGPLWEIPVNWETYNLAYNRAALERAGVAPPDTWDDFFQTAELIHTTSGGTVRGFAQRGAPVWHTMYTGYATQFWSCGGSDFDGHGRCAIAEPEGVAATQAFVDGLHAAGPPDWTGQRWYELALDFAAGRYALIVDSDHYVAFFEDESKSSMKGRTRYALPPAGPGGVRRPNMWTWSLVVNAHAMNKSEAWRFIEWAAGKEFLARAALEGNMNPTRLSTWQDPRFTAMTANWGDFAAVARDLVDHYSGVLVTPHVRYRSIADRWVAALISAYDRSQSVEQAMKRAASDIDAIVESHDG